MIWVGVCFALYFLYWFYFEQTTDSKILFLLLSISVTYKVLKLLHEWYNLYSIKVEPDAPIIKPYSVDVFTTYCPGEPRDVVTNTLLAIKNITYPHGTYLCCEGADEEFEEFCKKHGINYVFRTERTDAKAGNINNALKKSSAEILVILDSDHAPFPEFLDETIGHFDNEKVGFVQIVQSYGNQNDGFFAQAAAEQTYLFYGPILMGMHGKGVAQAIGSNCIFRRSALDSIGGHAAGLCEDLHTSMLLHAKGWESMYLPKVLSKGITPSSFLGFFKQQLKWSRGSFELFFEVLPKIFTKLNWRQKVHYITILLYFFTGLASLIDFVIPVVALYSNIYPISTDIIRFVLAYSGIAVVGWLIRQYVKQFLLEDHEKIFIWKSSILVTAVWWAYLKGLLLAIVGTKVPFIPSEKQNVYRNDFAIQFYNVLLVLLSLSAVVYGLQSDFTPFSIIMSGFALWNSMYLVVALFNSQKKLIKVLKTRFGWVRAISEKSQFIIVQLFSKLALPLVLIFSVVYLYISLKETDFHIEKSVSKINELGENYDVGGRYNGIYSTQGFDLKDTNFTIVSLYTAWGKTPFPYDTLLKIKAHNKIPMITWEPWCSDFDETKSDSLLSREIGICKSIYQGKFDFYLQRWADSLRLVNSPIFMRFAHEPGNPQYGWYNNSPEDYITAWKYVVDFFKRNKTSNVIWVWNPFRNFESYYPGDSYVDWIGITALNYGKIDSTAYWNKFNALYYRYEYYLNTIKKPVMLAEFGSTTFGGDNIEWFETSKRRIKKRYPEIKAVVYFDSHKDSYWPNGKKEGFIDWTFEGDKSVFPVSKKLTTLKNTNYTSEIRKLPLGMKGVNYDLKNDWIYNFKPLTRRQIEADINVLKDLKCNTIIHSFGDIYDYNILNITAENNLNLVYNIYLPSFLDYTNSEVKDSLLELTLLQIKKHKKYNNIIVWQLDSKTYKGLASSFTPPLLQSVRAHYLEFCNRLAYEIKKLDSRPVSFGIDERFLTKEVAESVSLADAFAVDVTSPKFQIPELQKSYYIASFGDLDVFNYAIDDYEKLKNKENTNYPYFTFRSEIFLDQSKFDFNLKDIFTQFNQDNNCLGYFYSNLYQSNFKTKTWNGVLDENGNKTILYSAFKYENYSIKDKIPVILNSNFPYFEGKNYAFSTDFSLNNIDLTYEWILCRESVIEVDRFYGKQIKLQLPTKSFTEYHIYLNVIDKQNKRVYQNNKTLILG